MKSSMPSHVDVFKKSRKWTDCRVLLEPPIALSRTPSKQNVNSRKSREKTASTVQNFRKDKLVATPCMVTAPSLKKGGRKSLFLSIQSEFHHLQSFMAMGARCHVKNVLNAF